MTNGTIGVQAIIRRAQFNRDGSAADGYRIVARWFVYEPAPDEPGQQRAVLPKVVWDQASQQFVSDKFELSISASDGSTIRYFDPAVGDFVAADPGAIVVEPLLGAMVRAPTEMKAIYDIANGDRPTDRVAAATPSRTERPAPDGKPVSESQASDSGFALTMRDLLFDSDPATARGAQYATLHSAIEGEITKFVVGEGGYAFAQGASSTAGDQFTAQWLGGQSIADRAATLVEKCLQQRPDRLFDSVKVMQMIQSEKHALATAVGQRTADGDVNLRLADLAVISRALAYPAADGGSGPASLAMLDYLDDQRAYRETAREALSASSSQGGRWFVYEREDGSDPLSGTDTDSPFGQAMPNELAGLGWISPVIDRTIVESWANFTQIGLSVTHQPTTVAGGEGFAQIDSGRYFTASETGAAASFERSDVISREGIKRALFAGSSHPIKPPSQSVLLLDKVQGSPTNPKYTSSEELKKGEGWEEEFHTPTNDSMVRIRMRSDNSFGTGFVLYAQWRPADGDDSLPGWEELRPFAVNQRTSLLTDIYHAYRLDARIPGQDDPGPRIRALASHPPLDPIVPRMTGATNATELLDQLRLANNTPYEDEEVSTQTPYDIAMCDRQPNCDLGDHSKDSWTSFDLRLGTHELPAVEWGNYRGWADSLGIRWDHNLPVDPSLAGHQIVRPDTAKYRFLVGCVDMFGQESAVIPVDCHEDEVGQGLAITLHPGDYVPRQRRALKGPPKTEDDGNSKSSPSIEYKFDLAHQSGLLSVSCTTPERDQVGMDGPESENPAELRCRVRIYRRFLRGATEGVPVPPQRLLALDPQTKEVEAWQARQGFVLFDEIVIEQPVDDTWKTDVGSGPGERLLPKDHGFEYRAAIRFERRDEVLKHYLPDNEERPHHRIVKAVNGSAFTLETELKPERYSTSYYEFTGTAAAQSLTLQPAAPLKAADQSATYISQIGTAGSVSRDLVLGNLLSRTVTTHDNQPSKLWPPEPGTAEFASSRIGNWQAWKGPRYYANAAQVAVIEAAMIRAGCKVFQPEWRPFVELQLRDFARVSKPDTASRTVDPTTQQIDQYDIVGLRGYVSLSWTIDAAAEVPPTDFVIYSQRGDAVESRKQLWTVRAEDPNSDGAGGAYHFRLAVPGGYNEVLSWHVVARSSVGTESASVELFRQEFVGTLVPDPVEALEVSPVAAGSGNILPPAQIDFVPTAIQGSGAADLPKLLRNAARLALDWSWTAPTGTSDKGVYVLVSKERRQWAGSSAQLAEIDDAKPLRDELSRIAAVPMDQNLQLTAQTLKLLTPWLDGLQDANLPEENNRHLFPWDGKPAIPVSGLAGLPDQRTKFLDYFHDVEPTAFGSDRAMEYTHEYSYSVATYIELPDSGAQRGPTKRVLASQPTAYSIPRIPVVPEWTVDTDVPADVSSALNAALPTLGFELRLEDARQDIALASTLALQCLVVRKIAAPNDSTVAHYVPLGRPVTLSAGSAKDDKDLIANIDGGEIARPGPASALEIDCELRLGLMLLVGRERVPLGGMKSVPFTMSVPAPPLSEEIRIHKILKVRLGE